MLEQWKVLVIYKRSVEERCLRYTTYLDGSSKSSQDVVNANPYPGKTCNRYECVGHVQKRVTAHLNTLIQEYKGVVLVDKNKLWKGRLTQKTINILYNYYGMVIRRNAGNLYGMKKDIAAIICSCFLLMHLKFRSCILNIMSTCSIDIFNYITVFKNVIIVYQLTKSFCSIVFLIHSGTISIYLFSHATFLAFLTNVIDKFIINPCVWRVRESISFSTRNGAFWT